ncbi:MAG: DUF3710 domain-containing protein [Frankiaceae bacterium]|nr:DUF3710 domain-containing protein [Frankiaceae bacterium]MBV9369555.1 DUF3710 domain-containing protein [Frankiales bacterium]
MPLFRRRRDEIDDEYDEGPDGEFGDESDEDAPPVRTPTPSPQGPWDSADVADATEVNRLDLGTLQVPVPEGCEIRVEVQEDNHTVIAATLVQGNSALQMHAFAAPRTEGIWADVRTEIVDSLRASGGSAEDAEGPFGTELRARIPAEIPGQGVQLQPARFIGVDGPRWFLRGLFTGPAATDPNQARLLESAFRDVVVVRGGEAMAPRELLALKLPKEALAAMTDQQMAAHLAAQQAADEQAKPTLDMLERGPEITETR